MGIGVPTTYGSGSFTAVVAGAVTLTTSANLLVGALAVVCVASNSATETNVTSISDGTNNYSKAVSVNNTSGSAVCEIWYIANAVAVGSGATLTVDFGNSIANGVEVYASQASGITSSPIDKTNSQINSATPSVATGTLTQAVEIIFGCIALGGTAPSGLGESPNFTQLYNHRTSNNNAWIDVGYDIVASTASVAYAPTPTGSGNSNTAVVVATFEGSASTGFLFDLANPLR